MTTWLNDLGKRLRRSLTEHPERFAGASAVPCPLALLAVERERQAAAQRTAGDVIPGDPPGV
jgi:hypothetical protein